MDKLFIDTNILIYSNDWKSPFNELTLKTLIDLSKSHNIVISTQTIREYAKFVTVTSNFENALKGINIYINQFKILYESRESFEKWFELIEQYKIIGKLVFDCNIVATMLVNDVKKILTNNPNDFIKFNNEIIVIPLIK